ncbi:hypothetical protein QBC34DRAFT_383018 [Podospora aff. communis PSN243]|uniref:Uncharacterized protein n=1 Tax=Podospora aff. communis PSN243 TaxID=3040156 RepID=A0AAV9GFM3_9PEZI|nr:hypothetical protein QBC34DRAFT_383018 [Podospora aff. communis PSN243]
MATRSQVLATLCLVALLPTWTQAQPNTANLSEQYILCEKTIEIDILQQTHNLIQVDATPTPAAIHPSWPTALTTLTINLCILLWSRFTEHGVYPNRVTPFILPFGLTALWFTTFVAAQPDNTTAGWIPTNLTTLAALTATLIDWFVAVFIRGDSRRIQKLPTTSHLHLLPVIAFLSLATAMFAAILATIIQRLLPTSAYGTIAYAITDTHGCTPHLNDDFSFLQRGARSRIFAIIQLAQLIYSILVILALIPFALGKGRRMAREMMLDTGIMHPRAFGGPTAWLVTARGFARCMQLWLPVAGFVAGFPLLVYGTIVATRGTPVVVSGDCMLVEMSPRFGGLDWGEVELWWRVLVVGVGH